MIVDNAIYVDGKRAAQPEYLRETYDACRSRRGIAWIGLYRPTAERFESVAGERVRASSTCGRGRDVRDHVRHIMEPLTAGYRELLQSILSVNLTLVGLGQKEEVRRISARAAILFSPTLIGTIYGGTIYGMNFEHMPELHWLLGYPFALALKVLISPSLCLIFKRRGWL
jgi:Mg2+ and Co2+ transporter CorA